MALTPAEVHNIAFGKPPIGQRGYNEDEVDQFLDLIEVELAGYIADVDALKKRNQELETAFSQQPEESSDVSADYHQVQETLQSTQAELHAAHQEIERLQLQLHNNANAAAQGLANNAQHSERATKIIVLAEQLATQHETEAKEHAHSVRVEAERKAEQKIAEAHARATSLVTDAQNESNRLLTSAQARSQELVTQAEEAAETRIKEANEHAAKLKNDAERTHNEIMATINKQRDVLESRIEQLKVYEREYRTRLRSYLESLLADLQDRGSAEPVDSPDSSH